MKKGLLLAATVILGMVSGLASRSVGLPLTDPGPVIVHGEYASQALTIEEVTTEADVIVRVRVEKVHPVRELRKPLEPRIQKPHHKDDVVPFQDSRMEVLEVYKGSVDQKITVVQTGGALAVTDRNPAVNFAFHDDPLFVEGQECVLFLKNISGDKEHAKDRKLYRMVNGAGRYDVEGLNVVSHTDFDKGYEPPKTLMGLVGQTIQAVQAEQPVQSEQ